MVSGSYSPIEEKNKIKGVFRTGARELVMILVKDTAR
jgi:hypothetical protein